MPSPSVLMAIRMLLISCQNCTQHNGIAQPLLNKSASEQYCFSKTKIKTAYLLHTFLFCHFLKRSWVCNKKD